MSDRERQLSEILQSWTLPDTFQPPEVFRARVMLRLSRRVPVRTRYLSWKWHLVPVGLICILVGLLGLLGLLGLVSDARALLAWAGIDLAPGIDLASLPGGSGTSMQLLAPLVRVLGGWTLWLSLYALLVLVFAAFLGWLGVLWRATGQPIVRKER